MEGGSERKAHDVVPLKKCLRIEDIACEVVSIDASECVWLAGISTKSDQFWVCQFYADSFGGESGYGVFVPYKTAIPL